MARSEKAMKVVREIQRLRNLGVNTKKLEEAFCDYEVEHEEEKKETVGTIGLTPDQLMRWIDRS